MIAARQSQSPPRELNEENLRLIFGLKVHQSRRQRHLSLKELSEAAGLSISYLHEIERGKKFPKTDKALALAKALKIPYADLISPQLGPQLQPLAPLLQTPLLQEIPFELFGIQPSDFVDLMAQAPARFSAFIDTFVQIAWSYDVRVEDFLLSALRSYVELHHNHFPEIEDARDTWIAQHQWPEGEIPNEKALAKILKDTFGVEIDLETLPTLPELRHLRAITLPHHPPRLLLNPQLLPSQRAFLMAREIGYHVLGDGERLHASPWPRVESFDAILNHYRASYFAGALLLPRNTLIPALEKFFARKKWSAPAFLRLQHRFRATPEMFFHRLTQLLPAHFGLRAMYFLRFSHRLESNRFALTKEFHFSGLHRTHSIGLNEHYCRRWITVGLLQQLASAQRHDPRITEIADAQISQFWNTEDRYLCLSTARPLAIQEGIHSGVTLGFALNDALRENIAFWEDPAIATKTVHDTCERCGIADCAERAAEPTLYEKERRRWQREQALQALLSEQNA